MKPVIKQLIEHKGFRQHKYEDTENHATIGIGFNLDEGFTMEESVRLLEHRVARLEEQLAYAVSFWNQLSRARQDVLVNMAYNLGLAGLMQFRKMLAAMERGAWDVAAYEMLESIWASQVGRRAQDLATMMRHGVTAA